MKNNNNRLRMPTIYHDIHCDVPMRRSKEAYSAHPEAEAHGYPRWKCTGRCRECHCAIGTTSSGIREHITPIQEVER